MTGSDGDPLSTALQRLADGDTTNGKPSAYWHGLLTEAHRQIESLREDVSTVHRSLIKKQKRIEDLTEKNEALIKGKGK